MSFTPEIAQKRRGGIGGSEVSAILGIDSWSSPYKVWLRKTGREIPEPSNKYADAGTILESAVAEFFTRKTKHRIIKASAAQKVWVHPQYEWAIGMTDRIYLDPLRPGKGVLECKTTQASTDKAFDTWFTQLQWYLGVTGLSYGSVAWLERGVDFKYNEFEFDKSFFDFALGEVSKFWHENVLKDIPPEPINVDDVLRRFPRHSEGVSIDATPEMISAHTQLKAMKESIKELSGQADEMEAAIKLAMRDAEAVLVSGKPLFTWKASSPSSVFNKDSFKVKYPELYDEFLEEKEGSRRFLIK